MNKYGKLASTPRITLESKTIKVAFQRFEGGSNTSTFELEFTPEQLEALALRLIVAADRSK